MIVGPPAHGMARLVNLFGIELLGLTASLSIAEDVVKYGAMIAIIWRPDRAHWSRN